MCRCGLKNTLIDFVKGIKPFSYTRVLELYSGAIINNNLAVLSALEHGVLECYFRSSFPALRMSKTVSVKANSTDLILVTVKSHISSFQATVVYIYCKNNNKLLCILCILNTLNCIKVAVDLRNKCWLKVGIKAAYKNGGMTISDSNFSETEFFQSCDWDLPFSEKIPAPNKSFYFVETVV